MMHRTKLMMMVLLCCWNLMTFASNPVDSPLPILRRTAQRILSVLKQHTTIGAIKRHVSVHLLPIVDRDYMARLILGPQYWRSASVRERSAFVQELTALIVNTYAAAWPTYANERIVFSPLRDDQHTRNRIRVKSWIVYDGGTRVEVYYRLYRVAGQWKIYDFDVDSVSLVASYRAQFEPVLRKGGLSMLVKRLKSHNARRGHREGE